MYIRAKETANGGEINIMLTSIVAFRAGPETGQTKVDLTNGSSTVINISPRATRSAILRASGTNSSGDDSSES